MNCLIPDETRLRAFCTQLEQLRPLPHHGALLEEAGRLLPERRWTHVLSQGGWHRPGGLIAGDGSRLTADLEVWLTTELVNCGDDMAIFLERHADDDLLVTRHSGRLHYLVASYGPGPEQFVQLEVEELQETLERRLINLLEPPTDLEELLEPFSTETLEPHPVEQPRYRFRRLLDLATLIDRLNAPVGQQAPLLRFMSEWSVSGAAPGRHFSDHWIIACDEHQDRYRNPQWSAVPVSVQARKLRGFHWHPQAQGVMLGEELRAFDRVAGYLGAWYFHRVVGTLVPDDLPERLLADLEAGFGYLPDVYVPLLQGWKASPYGF